MMVLVYGDANVHRLATVRLDRASDNSLGHAEIVIP